MKSEILPIILSSHKIISEGNLRVNVDVNWILNLLGSTGLISVDEHLLIHILRCKCEEGQSNMSCTNTDI